MESGSKVIYLPSTKYRIGQEPNKKAEGITIHSAVEYVVIFKGKLYESLFQRLRNSLLGPIIKTLLRENGGDQKRDGLGFSGQIVHFLLSRQIITTRSNELWYHFAGQPMRFSLREFYLATGLPCEETDLDPSEEEACFDWPLIESGIHTLDDLYTQINRLEGENAEEGKYMLAMLLLIEGIFLMESRRSKMQFTSKYVELAKGNITTYAWGKLAFKVLIDSIKAIKDKTFQTSKYSVKGLHMALHLWFLAYVSEVEATYAELDNLDGLSA